MKILPCVLPNTFKTFWEDFLLSTGLIKLFFDDSHLFKPILRLSEW